MSGTENKDIFEEGAVLLFNKPLYWTSFDLVNKIRIMLKEEMGLKKLKVGHAGTLDPLATGLMIICTGKATKRVNEFRDMEKGYEATIHIGATTPSFDLETEIDSNYPSDHITRGKIEEVLIDFTGARKQVPPLHSAKMVGGKRAYEYARKGIEKELTPVDVYFRELELIAFAMPEIKVRIICSKGTYIRSFARDLGVALDSGCYLSALVRTSIGNIKLDDARTIEDFHFFLHQMKQT
ncbi:MAG TPA: tRNA pseudouridine(55) synthase TruB [Bacteroidales bacterium]|nr:tRNA pseudouridine(55) synthase TruB [Bacteroidales bacterium]HPF01897.1 tRNA pseudouridine(55) synthase TruB [Bacteroidales bacterium]